MSVSLCEGTYGTVFKAKNRESQEIVALKRVRLDDDDEVSSALLFYSSFLLFFYSSIVIFFYSSILIFLYSYILLFFYSSILSPSCTQHPAFSSFCLSMILYRISFCAGCSEFCTQGDLSAQGTQP